MFPVRKTIEKIVTELFTVPHPIQAGVIVVIAGGLLLLFSRTLSSGIPEKTEVTERTDRWIDSVRSARVRPSEKPGNQSVPPFGERDLPTRYRSSDSRTDTIVRTVRTVYPTVPVELNSADSALLTTVRGIGPVIARSIVRYRERLGGYVSMEQLKEVYAVTEDNFGGISAQMLLDTNEIRKIDINFASAEEMTRHPYFTGSMVRRILAARKTKGGWSLLSELIEQDILLPEEAKKVSPYVVFGQVQGLIRDSLIPPEQQ